jgi:hypothetical protein
MGKIIYKNDDYLKPLFYQITDNFCDIWNIPYIWYIGNKDTLLRELKYLKSINDYYINMDFDEWLIYCHERT